MVISDFAQRKLFECFLTSFKLQNLFSQNSETKAEKTQVTKKDTSGNEQRVQNKFRLSPSEPCAALSLCSKSAF